MEVLSLTYHFAQIHGLLIQLVHNACHFLDVSESHVSEDMLEVLEPFFCRSGIMGFVK